MTLDEIGHISAGEADKPEGISRLQELCFIGLLSYFEAFCKDHFASIINIEPTLIGDLKAAGQDVSVDAAHVALYREECERRIGFMLASNYDFGTSRKINALFGALLKVTPFGKEDARTFDQLLLDRHLLVHHGGIFTLRYLEQMPGPLPDPRTEAFFNSRTVGRREVAAALRFLEAIARKLLRATHESLLKYLEVRGLEYSPQRQKALHFLLWWGDSAA